VRAAFLPPGGDMQSKYQRPPGYYGP